MLNFDRSSGDGAKTCTYVVDGGELGTILGGDGSGSDMGAPVARLCATVGRTSDDGRRVVGIGHPLPAAAGSPGVGTVELRPGGIFLPAGATARVPDGMSDDDALSTAVASVAVHAMAFGVGGGTEEEDLGEAVPAAIKRGVVMGGDRYACFVAQALGALGVEVTRVSTLGGGSDIKGVEVIPPAVGELGLDFSSHVGRFDLLVDTLGDERTIEARGSDDPFGVEAVRPVFGFESVVIKELRRKFECKRYITTLTLSQKIIADSGVFRGPGRAKSYEDEARRLASLSSLEQIPPPESLSSLTLQRLLDSNPPVVFPLKISEGGALSESGERVAMRGWSLGNYLELTGWPRDAESGMRFGLPSIDDIDIDTVYGEEDAEEAEGWVNILSASVGAPLPTPASADGRGAPSKGQNPFVSDLGGIRDLNEQVLSQKKDCMLFLTAPWCRTCKTMVPGYTRFARKTGEEFSNSPVLFARADAVGRDGKELGRRLGVDSVPAFVLFRNGRRYGTNLSVSKLPSKKLEKAVAYLTSGRDWDQAEFEVEEGK